jgi:hypothetical protein
MTKVKRQKEICYFCGAKATSNDHLPPDTIFDDPKPSNLITVPSCDLHNSKQSKDDEYFGIIIKTASAKNPIAEKLIRTKVVNGFKRRPKLLFALLKKSREVEVVTPAGLIVGKAHALEYEHDRIVSVVTRITKGFYLKFCEKRLPDNYFVRVLPINPKLDPKIIEVMDTVPIHTIATGIFAFSFWQEPSDPNFTAWFFWFYDQTCVVSFTDKEPSGKVS